MAILGIDEVGRGPLAGPLVVGAVILPENKTALQWVAELKDSKKLSPKKREKLSEVILKQAPAWGLGWVEPDEIDGFGMTEALKLAARKAVEAVQRKKVKFTEIIIDGNLNFLTGTPLEPYVTTLIKGDDKIKEISAASIIAKVARDRRMMELAQDYPQYGWERNMGYGTKEHREAIYKYGVSAEHRKSFEPCKSITGFEPPETNATGATLANIKGSKNTTLTGKAGETEVAEYLKTLGHEIIAQNFKTKICEIDIVSVKGGKIYFTEVKTRKNSDYGGGAAAITRKKLSKMTNGAQVFLKMRPEYKNLDPCLAAGIVEGGEIKDWLTIH